MGESWGGEESTGDTWNWRMWHTEETTGPVANDNHQKRVRAGVYPGARHIRGTGREIPFTHPGARGSDRARDRPEHVAPL